MNPKPIEAEYDRESDALYLRLDDNAVAGSVVLDAFRVVDIDALGRPVGIEILTPARHFDLADIGYRFGLESRRAELEMAAQASVPGLEPQQTHSAGAISYVVSVASQSGFVGIRTLGRLTGTERSSRSYPFKLRIAG